MSSLAWLHPEELQELRGESCHHQFRWLLLKRRLFGHLQSALKHRMPIRRHRTITLVATDYREITVLSQYVVTFHDGWGNKYGLPDHAKGLPDLAADGRCLEEGVAANYSIFTSIILSKTNTTIFKIGYRWPFSNFTVVENYPDKSHQKVKPH